MNTEIKTLVIVFLALCVSAFGEPALPSGLGGEKSLESESGEPALPAGLDGGGTVAETESEGDGFELPFNFYGFWDTRFGWRLQDDPHQEDMILGEDRVQLGADRRWFAFGFKLVADFLWDYSDSSEDHIDLERGEGWIDLRQANILLDPLPSVDLKLGRQILTWGTGDLLFINDNFPKDWQSFFAGRDVEYLKAPSDALKASYFADTANLDLVYSPRFDPDRFITGNRISYYNAGMGSLAGQDAQVDADIPDDWFEDDEIAARLYHNIGGMEAALYGYYGYWKSPGGQNQAGEAIFPHLNIWGGSVRGTVAGGIGNVEVGYYDSRDDREGDDPMINNSEWRALLGYERDLKSITSDLTLGLQYYAEYMQDYDAYKRALPAGMPARDELRHVVTLRLTKLLMQQNLELSIFSYYSPSDQDVYARPHASYKIDDHWEVEAGGNIFAGEEQHTFFGQFENNSNAYAGLRYSF